MSRARPKSIGGQGVVGRQARQPFFLLAAGDSSARNARFDSVTLLDVVLPGLLELILPLWKQG
jgi:hypothetical protein